METREGARIHISGVVQGVGFRPFVYGLATRLELTGWVRNTSAGVDIEVDGSPQSLAAFADALRFEAPPLARIDEMSLEYRPANGFNAFEILESESIAGAFMPVSPDVSICPDCVRELFDPDDRRYRYPFINCTNCGPRFTIIEDIPYDRPKTTMAGFPLCPQCAAEYSDPLDRRFHAQPVACPDCGPQAWLELPGKAHPEFDLPGQDEALNRQSTEAAIREAQELLRQGKILAVKGLGGFHLACDAENEQAVAELRRRKLRVDKPFALMMPDLSTVEQHCLLSDGERELLASRERPVVILRRRPGSTLSPDVTPNQDTVGVMLPYTPLHYLLLTQDGVPNSRALVMTSGNVSEEPIAVENGEARQRLAGLADAFLMHNRPIHTRCDDSVMRVFQPANNIFGPVVEIPLRRSRGYAPYPVRLPFEAPPLLAAGAELKNTFCITRDRYAILSHHIGDLENYETLRSFEEGVSHFESLFRVQPQALTYDLHPNYLATRYALERARREELPAIGVQHHHAHIAACMAENGLLLGQPVIGVAFDGTGYGEDGAIWGGEFLVGDYTKFERAGHLAYAPLPGGDAAVRKPARIALAYLHQAGIEWDPNLPCVQALCAEEQAAVRVQLERGINAPLTSSMGRLFDAVAALAGVRQKVNYEAQAAVEMEALVDTGESGGYPFEIVEGSPIKIEAAPVIRAAAEDILRGMEATKIAARFHNGTARMVLDVCQRLQAQTGLTMVTLSGGVWQNMTLLGKTMELLETAGFTVLIHRKAPANDGGLALGQAAIAAARLLSGTQLE